MLNKKLLEILKLLNAPKLAKFRLFLQSPYFVNRGNAAELLRFYDYLIAYNVEDTNPMLSKSVVSATFFPNTPFKEGQKGPIDTLASDLFNLTKRFLVQSSFEENDLEFEEGLTMAKVYRQNEMEARFWQIIDTLHKQQQSIKIKDANYFQRQFRLNKEAGTFESMNNRFDDDLNLESAIQNLDIEYLINKIELLGLLLYQQKLTQSVTFDFSTPFSKIALELPDGYPQIPLYELNRMAFQLIEQPHNEVLFESYQDLLEQWKVEIPFEKLRNLKAYYRFFWNRRYSSQGDSNVRLQMFQVYLEHYEQGYFYEGDAIMINSLKVLILFGLKVKKYDWVKEVLDKHPPGRICGTKHPVEAHNLCLAEYYFYIKEYTVAVETLIYKHFENPNYSIWAELLLIKVYFETSDELLEYRMKALDQKVRRSKISAETKQRYYQFLQKLDKIIKYGKTKSNPKRSRLVEEIKTIPGIIEREWLLEKLGEGT